MEQPPTITTIEKVTKKNELEEFNQNVENYKALATEENFIKLQKNPTKLAQYWDGVKALCVVGIGLGVTGAVAFFQQIEAASSSIGDAGPGAYVGGAAIFLGVLSGFGFGIRNAMNQAEAKKI